MDEAHAVGAVGRRQPFQPEPGPLDLDGAAQAADLHREQAAGRELQVGRIEEARASLQRTTDPAEIDTVLASIQEATASEGRGRLREMLRKPYLRATVFVVGLGFFIQITGINATVAYGPRIFQAMGIDTKAESILMSTLVQCIALIAVLASMSVVDRWGRRPILLTGIAIMIVSQLTMVVTFATQQGGAGQARARP